jgi:hypothetical protein
MEPTTYPLTTAAFASGVELRTLRSWLDRGAIRFVALACHRTGAWRHAAPVDIVRAALTARLLRYGWELVEAQETLAETFDRHLGRLVSIDATVDDIIERLDGMRFVVTRTDTGIRSSLHWTADDPTKDHEHALVIDADRVARTVKSEIEVMALVNSTRGEGHEPL